MKIGIIGLPNVGKSTIFNALTRARAAAENYPFCTIDPNIGVVKVPDERLDGLHEMSPEKDKTPVMIKFIDIAGLVEGASRGEGLGNQFLSQIREVDAVAHVVRCFENSNISHIEDIINPIRDIHIINNELIMSDIELLQKQLDKTERMLKSGEKKYKVKKEIIEKLLKELNNKQQLRKINLNEKEEKIVKEYQLLTAKPLIYLANIDEKDIGKQNNQMVKKVRGYAKKEEAEVLVISAKLEADIAEFEDQEEAAIFLQDAGLDESGLDKLIKSCYKLLDLITFFTIAGDQEVRASTLKKGKTAPEAAGKIHTDMEKGFIKAEIIGFQELMKSGSIPKAREKGLLRLEGKDYIIKDGDICFFKFNVS